MQAMSRTTRPHFAVLFALAVLLSGARPDVSALASAAPPPNGCVEAPAPAAQSSPRGIPNFGQVTPALFRGGQPTTDGYRELKQMGVDIVVSFRHEKGENALEGRAVEAQGMRFVSLPWHPWDTPADADVERFFSFLAANRHSKVFVHCQQGRDRTGAMVALYRVAVDHWCPDSAVAEMKAYHYHHFWFPQLETYVEGFPDRMAKDHGLASSITLAPPTTP
jgi:protein tyrosine/serine phosphatase